MTTEVEKYANLLNSNSQIIPKVKSGQTTLENIVLCQKDWVNLICQRPIKDIETAIRLQTPTVVSLKNYTEGGEAYMIAVIMTIIKDVADNLNIGKSLNNQQLAFCARQIAAEYYFLKISEIRFCFMQGLMGRYGQIYDRIDISILMTWLGQYDSERAVAVEDLSRRKTEGLTGVYLDNAPNNIKQAFNKLFQSLKVQSENKDKAALMIYEYCQSTGKEFDTVLNRLLEKYNEHPMTLFDDFVQSELSAELNKIKAIKM